MKTTIEQTQITWDEAGSGRPLVFLHGLPFQRGMWSPQLQALAKSSRVIALDLPGFGESGPPIGVASMDALADMLAKFFLTLELGPVVLAGHSMGGYAGLAFARRHPTLLRGLVLVASRAISDPADVAANRRSMVTRLKSERPEFVAEAMLPRMLASESRDLKLRQQVRDLMNPLRSDGISWAQLAIAARADFSSLLGHIDCPALVVAGAKDAVVPLEESGIVAAGFPQGRFEVIEGAGHMVSWEQPLAFNTALSKWLSRL